MNNGQANSQGARGPARPINIRQSQVPQLAQAYQNEMNLARQATDEQVRSQHFQKAQSIKQILLTYQAQQKARQAQAQQGGPVLQGVQLGAQGALQTQPNTNQTMSQQGLPQGPQIGGSFVANAANRAPSSTGTMGAGVVNVGTPSMAASSPIGGVSTPNIQNNAPQNQPPATQGGQGVQPKPSPAETVKKFNQVKARLTEFQKEVEKLEYTKRNYQFTPEQLASVDTQISKIKQKQQQYETYGVYLKQQLVAQARAKQQQQTQLAPTGQLPQLSGNTAGSQMGTPAAAGLPFTAPTPGSANIRNQGAPSRPQQLQQQPQQPTQQQQRANYGQSSSPLTAGAGSGTVGTPGFAPGQGNMTKAPLVGLHGLNLPENPALAVPAASNSLAIPKGRLASPSNGSNAVATPNKASPPISSSTGMSLSGITKPSVPSIPISSSIDVKPPAAVILKPNMNSRPTLMGGTANSVGQILGTPGIVKLPTYELSAGAGDSIPDNAGRVLTKRKLNELVNTIGADEGDGKTNIDGDVEELLLDLADEFILLVTGFACRLAKHRKVELVDVRDIQLHLERNWNIRIPGYAMDEIITARKWQPTSGYQQKVQGVDIAKSVDGNIQ